MEQPERYTCHMCNYTTIRLNNWKKHLTTKKHLNRQNGIQYTCDVCNKNYKFSSGLSRHKMTCGKQLVTNESKLTSDMFYEIMKQNNKLQETIAELSKKPSVVNVHNKKMTINVFLQTHCKDAMNLSDFLNKVNVSLDDLSYTTTNGYIEGISNIFYKNLEVIKPTERPFHCSDKKRLQFYVKDEDKWEKDKDQIGHSIDKISHKQIKQIKEWEKQFPKWNESDNETEMYWRMIQQVMGGKDDTEREKNKEQIIRNISGSTNIKDAMITTD